MLNMDNFCWSLWENSITRILKVTLDSILTVIVVDKAEDRALNIYLKNNIMAIFQCSRSQTSLERQIFNDFDILIILKVRNLVSSPALTLATRIYISITCACFLCNLKIADARNVVFFNWVPALLLEAIWEEGEVQSWHCGALLPKLSFNRYQIKKSENQKSKSRTHSLFSPSGHWSHPATTNALGPTLRLTNRGKCRHSFKLIIRCHHCWHLKNMYSTSV